MKLLLDANLSPRLVSSIADLFPDTAHVFKLGLGPDDEAIWTFARDNMFMILSKNSDFYRFSMLRGAPPKVAWLRVGNDDTPLIGQLIRTRAQDPHHFAASTVDAMLILDKKIAARSRDAASAKGQNGASKQLAMGPPRTGGSDMDVFIELMWRGGPTVIAVVGVIVLAYGSMAQAERERRRAQKKPQPGE